MCFVQLKCPRCTEPVTNLCSPVQAPSLPSGLRCPCWDAEMEGHPSDRQGMSFFSFIPPSTANANALNLLSPKQRWCQMTSTGGNANKRCDFLHLSCRLSFTDQCAGGSQCPRSDQSSWLKTKTGPRCCRALAQSIARGCLVHLSRDAHG